MKAIIITLLTLFILGAYSTAQTQHGESITWIQSPTPGITGNALKCGTVTKTYTLVWTFSAPTTTYDWTTADNIHPPVQGQTYFCIVTATKGVIESGPSPEITFQFPQVPLPPPGVQRTEH